MLFKLPEDLHKSLSGEVEVKKKDAPAKRNVLGKLDDLFPLELLSKDEQLKAVDEVATGKSDYIRGGFIRNKFWSKEEYSFYLAYHSGLWLSFWSKKYTRGSDFIFGFSLAFKKSKNKERGMLADIYSRLPKNIKNRFVDKRYAKTDFSYLTAKVTIDNFFEYNSILSILEFHHFYGAGKMIKSSFGCKDLGYVCGHIPGEIAFECIKKDPRNAVYSNLASVEGIQWSARSMCKDFFKFPDTPLFRKKAYEYMKYVENTLYKECKDPVKWFNTHRFIIQNTTQKLNLKSSLIKQLKSLYSDISLDLLHKLIDSGNVVFPDYLVLNYNNSDLDNWLRENVKPHTFVSLLCAEDSKLLIDTLRMLNSMKKSELDKLGKPSRWRNRSFHDHVMVESFKNKGKDKPLPAELFPEPIKVGDWTYSQPRSTLELLCWGKSAMNCIGSSDYYASKVLNRYSLIILASENGKPRLTIELGLKENKILEIQDTVRGHAIPATEMAEHAKRFLEAIEKVSAPG